MAKAYPLLIAIVLGGVLSGAPAAAAPASAPSLSDAVTTVLLGHAPATLAATARSRAQVTVQRRDGSGWAFGSAVLTASAQPDAYPLGWLFLAHREAGGWRVELEGDQGFTDLAGGAAVLSTSERQVFTTPSRVEYAGGDFRTGMRLPYAVGQSWSLTGGPHGWGGSEAPWSSVDLSGGDGRVLAPRAGLAYTMCSSGRGWIRVIHDRGYSTDYYHLFNNISANGLSVSEGTFLGNIGTDVSCGGSATGAHVHFALRQNSAYVPIADHNFGKWVIRVGGAVYQGSALHGSAQVGVGGALYNYGALGLTQGVIDANGGGTVNKRSGPGTGYGVVGSVADGATVSIACSASGTSHTGRWGTTSLWNKLTDGTWISDAFIWTGSNGTVNGTC
ncbi:peptidoglycan DD-metalloendopeptidase family protein [Hamadaea sp. NPDC051192]|uniref:peptidoglycan DD-metalloendopeptidase family protein n=1 Tax=Hamadaea sp. NPDC051192 TaxID=3154940 RepID=UPI003415673A